MFILKDKLLGLWLAIKREYARTDRTCNNCGREIFGGETLAEKYFCPDCAAHLPFNGGYICAHCGRSTTEPTKLCDDCVGFESAFAVARSPFYYAPPIDKLIRKEKYENRKYFSEILGKFAAAAFVKNFSDADVIAFVPMTERARKKRGYNQSELLANEVSAETGVPAEEILVKVSETERQAKLGRNERLSNLKNSFKVRNKALIENKTVVVIDDVFTTGATAEACSAAIMKAGAGKVYVLTVASVTNPKTARALGQEGAGVDVRRPAKKRRKTSGTVEKGAENKKRK